MPKPFLIATVVVPTLLILMLACAAPTTAVAPTATLQPAEPTQPAVPPATGTPTPAPTAAPTAMRLQPPTPGPTSTELPTSEEETKAGILSPLNLYETKDSNSEISVSELACIKESGIRFWQTWASTLGGPGNQEERLKIIGCLKDETAARIFLADIAQVISPLSMETSTCVRAAFKEIDPRSMLLAKVEGFPEDTLNSATTLYFVTMACLSDEEWETDARSLWEDSEVREVMRCMMEKLGGPGEMAAAMTKGEEEEQKVLAETVADCGEEMGPIPGETPAAPTAAPESVRDSERSSIVPLNPDDLDDLLSRLTQYERDCITDLESLAGFLSKPPLVDYQDVTQKIGCLGDETLLHLELARLARYLQGLGGELGADTASCIQEGLKGISIGVLIHEIHTAKPSIVRQMHNGFRDLTVFYCLSEEEAALALPDSGITDEDYDAMICTVEAFGGLEGLNKGYRNTGAEEFTKELLTNASNCQGVRQ